jgi:hypothetical protein
MERVLHANEETALKPGPFDLVERDVVARERSAAGRYHEPSLFSLRGCSFRAAAPFLLAASYKSASIFERLEPISTRVFPRLERDRLALKLNGKDDKLRRADFRALAGTAGLRAGEADAAIDDLIARMNKALDRVTLPKLDHYGAGGEGMATRMLALVRSRLASFT